MTSTEIQPSAEDIAEIVGVPVGALAIRPDQTKFDDTQRAALAHIGLARCPDADVEAFLHICQRTRLDPWTRQIYLIERQGKWTPQTAIDGFRVIAERRDEYTGTTDIEWCGEDGDWTKVWLKKTEPHAARCSAKRSDREDPITAVVLFAEFTAGNAKWRSSPVHMIGKCAEAGALRRAFPQDFAGLFIPEETDALTAQRTKVASQRGPSGPVDNSELTGQAPPKDTPKKADAPPAAAADSGDKMTPQQQKRLFALIREAKVGDRNAYATNLLGRTITSFGQLTQGDAATLMTNLEGMLAGDDDEPVEAEIVDEAQGTLDQAGTEQ